MTKTKKQAQNETVKVEMAIRSLWEKFKSPSSGCRSIKNKKIVDLTKKINRRRKELDADKVLKDLNVELKEERCRVKKEADALHHKVDDLMRRFQLRGVSEQLISDIEELAKNEPVYDDSCDCGGDD